jgi:hypothetical protein
VTWHTFDWEAFVTPDLVREIAAATGARRAATGAAAAPLLARLFEKNGGLPVCRRVPGLRRRTEIGRQLLHESLRHVAGAGPVAVPGYSVEEGAGRLGLVRAAPRLAINSAPESAVAALPGIRAAVARRIARARLDRPFTDTADLAARVEGLPRSTARSLASQLSFEIPSGEPTAHPPGSLAEDLRRLAAAQPGARPLDRLVAALELLVARSAADRHPQAARAAIRELGPALAPALEPVSRIEILAGSTYYGRVRALIARARRRIDVCMFHIASAGPRHPTGRILDALARARARGVRVRVLVDRDRPQDPYHSNVINAFAIRRLRESGIRVRVDASDRLLHSKFVVIDDRYVVIGSHNWTAGSYFEFDDVSFLVVSPQARRAQTRRFEELWRRGEVPGRRRHR